MPWAELNLHLGLEKCVQISLALFHLKRILFQYHIVRYRITAILNLELEVVLAPLSCSHQNLSQILAELLQSQQSVMVTLMCSYLSWKEWEKWEGLEIMGSELPQ